MKKYMIADLVKDITDSYLDQRNEDILAEMNRSDVDEPTAAYLVDNWSSEADRDQVLQVAESLGLDPQDVEDDDVENYMEMGWANGEIESSSGIIQWIYDNKLKAYIVLMMIEENALMYLIDNNMMKEWINSDSAGGYYNDKIRGNKQIESQGESSDVPCGCGPNPCEQGKIDQFNSRYNSIL